MLHVHSVQFGSGIYLQTTSDLSLGFYIHHIHLLTMNCFRSLFTDNKQLVETYAVFLAFGKLSSKGYESEGKCLEEITIVCPPCVAVIIIQHVSMSQIIYTARHEVNLVM